MYVGFKRGVFSMLLYSPEGDTFQQYFPLWSMLNAIATRANSVLLYSQQERNATPRQKFHKILCNFKSEMIEFAGVKVKLNTVTHLTTP